MLMEEKKLPVIVGSIAFAIKQEQILHQQPVQAGQKTLILKLQNFCLIPHSLTAAQIFQSTVYSSKKFLL